MAKILKSVNCLARNTALSALIVGSYGVPAYAHDITGAHFTERAGSCADYVSNNTASATNAGSGITYEANVTITLDGETCTLSSNAVPNHDFGIEGGFVNAFFEQTQTYTISANPVAADAPTPLSLRTDNAVFLNGVKLDQLAAGCFGVGNGFIGCFEMDTPYRYDPMSPTNDFGTDAHNAHTQPDGSYHYHGNPMAMFQQVDPTVASPVVGFAADGFPIFGSFINDNGTIRAAKSSYKLKEGVRPGGPGGTYDGTFIDDWVYVEGSGDLDACNGMSQSGIYGYVVTNTYPWVMGCFTGTPNPSFNKPRPRQR